MIIRTVHVIFPSLHSKWLADCIHIGQDKTVYTEFKRQQRGRFNGVHTYVFLSRMKRVFRMLPQIKFPHRNEPSTVQDTLYTYYNVHVSS